MLEYGIFEMLRENRQGLTREEICRKTGLGDYAVKCLLEASLCIGTVLIDVEKDRYKLSKTGWFITIDPAAKVVIVNKLFGFKIKPEEMQDVETFSQFCDYIEKNMTGKDVTESND